MPSEAFKKFSKLYDEKGYMGAYKELDPSYKEKQQAAQKAQQENDTLLKAQKKADSTNLKDILSPFQSKPIPVEGKKVPTEQETLNTLKNIPKTDTGSFNPFEEAKKRQQEKMRPIQEELNQSATGKYFVNPYMGFGAGVAEGTGVSSLMALGGHKDTMALLDKTAEENPVSSSIGALAGFLLNPEAKLIDKGVTTAATAGIRGLEKVAPRIASAMNLLKPAVAEEGAKLTAGQIFGNIAKGAIVRGTEGASTAGLYGVVEGLQRMETPTEIASRAGDYAKFGFGLGGAFGGAGSALKDTGIAAKLKEIFKSNAVDNKSYLPSELLTNLKTPQELAMSNNSNVKQVLDLVSREKTMPKQSNILNDIKTPQEIVASGKPIEQVLKEYEAQVKSNAQEAPVNRLFDEGNMNLRLMQENALESNVAREDGSKPRIQMSQGADSIISNKITETPPSGMGNEMVKRSEIEKFLSDTLDVPVAQGKFRQKALGIFKVQPEVIRLKETKDLDTLYHEAGHFLDKKLNLTNEVFSNELLELGKATSKDSYTRTQKMEEGVAEFVRHYVADPMKAKETAPNFYNNFENILAKDKNLSDMFGYLRTATENYIKQSPELRLLSNISVGENAKKSPMNFNKLYSMAIDDLTKLEKTVKDITGGEKVATMRNPYDNAVRYKGWSGKAETSLNHAVLDKNFNKVGKSFEEVLKPITETKSIEKFRAYAIAKRAKELEQRGIKTGLNVNDIESVLQSNKSNVQFENTLKELVAYQDNVMKQTLLESGLLSKDAYNAMRKLNQDYIPFYRVMEDARTGTGKGFQSKNPIKNIKGSTRDIIDPLESIVKNTYLFTNLAERNKIGKSLVELTEKFEGTGKFIDKVPPKMVPTNFALTDIKNALADAGADLKNVDLETIATIFKPTNYKNENIITVFRNGKPEYWQVFDKELYNTMMAMDSESANTFMKILSYPAKVLRAGAILTPEFAARNPIRDAWSAFIYSKYNFIPGVDTAKGIFHAMKKDDMYYKWLSSGAANSTMASLDREYLQKNMRQIIGKQIKQSKGELAKSIITSPIRLLRAISELSEEATRIGEFAKGVKKEGATQEGYLKSALGSRDITLDFARAGSAGKQVNKIIAFFNASLQGTDKLIREFKNNPFKTTSRAIASVTLPSIALYLINRDNPKYQELPQWQKDTFWILPVGDNLYRIPKPFEIGILFGTVPERIMEYIDKNDSKAFEGLASRFADTFIPNGLPTALLPIVEALTNYSFFRGTNIDNQGDKNLQPWRRYNETTSETSKAIGKTFNVSPKIVENTIQGYGGGLARYVTDLIDYAAVATGNRKGDLFPSEPTKIPVFKGFATKPYSSNSKSVQEFYNELHKLETQYATDKEEGDVKELDGFSDANRLRQLRNTGNEIREYRKEIEKIRNSNENQVQQKAKMDALVMQIINSARKALNKPIIK